MEPLGVCTKYAMVISVISVIALFITPRASEGFYLSLISLVVSLIVAVVGFIIINKRAKKEEKEEEKDEVNN